MENDITDFEVSHNFEEISVTPVEFKEKRNYIVIFFRKLTTSKRRLFLFIFFCVLIVLIIATGLVLGVLAAIKGKFNEIF